MNASSGLKLTKIIPSGITWKTNRVFFFEDNSPEHRSLTLAMWSFNIFELEITSNFFLGVSPSRFDKVEARRNTGKEQTLAHTGMKFFCKQLK